MIDRVTITGADDSVSPDDLVKISAEFPFVEWGILASESQAGKTPRFPSWEWMVTLQARASQFPMSLSLHLCGRWVRDLLLGKRSDQLSEGTLFLFQRVQLNFHAENTPCHGDWFHLALRDMGNREFIFQIDGKGGNRHMESLWDRCDKTGEQVRSTALFDISGGAGILPQQWPQPIWMQDDTYHDYHGYAGGLGPENLTEQIPLILEAAGDKCPRIWIDMETRVRSDSDRLFDLAKVRRCLEIAAPHVGKQLVTA